MKLTYDRVLVTGGAGFIGSHTTDMLLNNGAKVWVLDDLSSGSLRNLNQPKSNPRFRSRRQDIRNYKAVNNLAKKVDAIIHLAAVVSPNISLRKPELTNEVNVSGTLNVLQAALKNQVGRVVFASSSSVYGSQVSGPISEDAPLNPITPYGVSKLAAEHYCRVYQKTFDLSTIALRYFNVYGERQSSNPYSGAIAIFAKQLSRDLRPTIYGDGDQTRDFIHVSDVVRANLQALETQKGIGESFNIATGQATGIKELLHVLTQLTGKTDVTPDFKEARKGDIRESCAKITKARGILGFEPQVALKTGLGDLVRSLFR